MKIQHQENKLFLSGIAELSTTTAAAFREETRAALTPQTTAVDADLSETRFLDSSGLGALIALHKILVTRGGALRILRPSPLAQQILELTRLHRILEIIPH
jgi:anti-sigma B factor antagonist